MSRVEGYSSTERVKEDTGQAEGYVKEFTRHAADVLINLNELRHQGILTDTTLVVGTVRLRAHCSVLTACSGFFYSLFSGSGPDCGPPALSLSLPEGLDADSVSLLLDFMYTSRLYLCSRTVPGVLAAATYLQMYHVADACQDFMLSSSRSESQASHGPGTHGHRQPNRVKLEADPLLPSADSQHSPSHSSCQPSFSESCSCGQVVLNESRPTFVPEACNWKKYKHISLNSLCAAVTKEEEPGATESTNRKASPPKPLLKAWPLESHDEDDRLAQGPLCSLAHSSPSLALCHTALACKTEPISHLRPAPAQDGTGDKLYHCTICGAQFNRPANLKTHFRIHSGEKPYQCDTCGARFVQVAHLRAHILIHTGEKPHPCHTCGTRFRHLQTLKSHLRIHTGEKPYACAQCDLRFRHKSHLHLHQRQKHGAVTNTKTSYKVLADPYRPLLQSC